MAERAVLAIDEGTTNCKAILVSKEGDIIASGSALVPIEHPKSGWVQQDAEAIWAATLAAISLCTEAAATTEILAIGISNQRESIMIWDRDTGAPCGPVVTWQCRRTSVECDALKQVGHEPDIIARTGLPLDPLFPPTKVAWLLDQSGAQDRNICVGTVDSWLIWKLSGGAVHATDRSNAARTQLFNLGDLRWDETLCDLFGVDIAMLPEAHDSGHVFGSTRRVAGLADGIPIASAIGDSHAALFGHGAFGTGDSKVTFGTGSSVMTTIPAFVVPPKGITTTIAWSLDDKPTYSYEGNILVSASILPWTAEMLGLDGVDRLLDLAQTVPSAEGVSLVPAHVGLGSPYWEAEARGLICGLSFGTKPAHLARAAAESMALQVQDVYAFMAGDLDRGARLFVDGGPSANRFLMQILADYLDHSVTPCRSSEASALGAAYIAGLTIGFWPDLETVAGLTQHEKDIFPNMPPDRRNAGLSTWRNAIARTTFVE